MLNLLLAFRLWRKTPGFSLLIVLILALGIGANTAIFTLVQAALLKPLPYRDASQLLSVSTIDRSGSDTNGCLSYPHFQLLAGHSRTLSSIAAFTSEIFSLSHQGEAVPLSAARVSWNFFDLLSARPTLGRTFRAEEGKTGGKPVVLISDGFWRRWFHGNTNVVGQSLSLDAKPYTIIGVLPRSFSFGLLGTEADVWTPRIDELNLVTPQQIQGGTCYLNAVARLARGASLEQTRAEMRVLDQQYLRDFPKMGDADPQWPVEVVPLKAKLVGHFQSIFRMLAGAVALVLVTACANAAGLLLARALQRRREVAVRLALGAEPWQLVRQFLTESVVLAWLGGMAGLALSLALTRFLAHWAGQSLPRLTELPRGVEGSVLFFTLGLSMASGVLFGLAPALQLSRTNVSASLREEGRGTAGARSRNAFHLLVTGQMALSLILLVGAGLLIRSFLLLAMQSPGFQAPGVLSMNVALPPTSYAKPDRMINFFEQLVQRVELLPGVKAAAVSSALPINVARLTPILVEGQPALPLAERPIVIVQTFTASYLRVMRIPLIQGRFFDAYDRRDSP